MRGNYPFKTMKYIGEYAKVVFPTEAKAMKARIASGSYGSINNMKFKTKITDGCIFEVWRVK